LILKGGFGGSFGTLHATQTPIIANNQYGGSLRGSPEKGA